MTRPRFGIHYTSRQDAVQYNRIELVVSGLVEIASGLVKVLSAGELFTDWALVYALRIADREFKRYKETQDEPNRRL